MTGVQTCALPIYTQNDGTLDLNVRGGNKVVAALQEIFAQTILKLGALPPDEKDDRVYDLAPLMKPDFEFSFAVGSGIQRAVVKKLRLVSRFAHQSLPARISELGCTQRYQD